MRSFFALSSILAGIGTAKYSPGTVYSSDPLVVLYYDEWSEWAKTYHVSSLEKTILSRGMPVKNWVINLSFLTWANGDCRLAPTDIQASFSKQDVGWDAGATWFTPGEQWGSPAGGWSGVRALRQKYPYIKIIPSVGGWSASHTFSDCIRNRVEQMIDSAVDTVRYFTFDGLDLDWEYPNCPPATGSDAPANCGCQKEPTCPNTSNKAADEDWEVYKDFVKKLREAFDTLEDEMQRKLYVTAALNTNPSSINADGEVFTASLPVEWICDNDYFDWVNLMTYDMYGPWSSKTGHLAPLYAQNDDPDADQVQISVADSVQKILDRCSRPEKLVMGLSAYGKNWANVPATGRIPGLWQTSENTHSDVIASAMTWGNNGTFEAGTVSFWDIKKNYLTSSDCTRTWDDVAKAPTIHCTTSPQTQLFSDWYDNTFVSYEDKESWAAKMAWAKSKGMSGAIIWAASDTGNVSNDAVADLYSGIFMGWYGKDDYTLNATGNNGAYTFKLPTMAEIMATDGVDASLFPCPFQWTSDPINDNFMTSTEVILNKCYTGSKTSWKDDKPLTLFQGSGTQDTIGKDVVLIGSGSSSATTVAPASSATTVAPATTVPNCIPRPTTTSASTTTTSASTTTASQTLPYCPE